MKFAQEIRNNIYNPGYYQELLTKPFSYSLKYFFTLAILVALVSGIVFLFSVGPGAQSFLNTAGGKILDYYPAELQIVITKGHVSTNVSEPYFMKLPQELKDNMAAQSNAPQDTENLLVIDTKSAFTVDQFKSYRTLVLLTGDTLIHYDKNGIITVQPLDQISNFTLNKDKISSFLAKVRPYFGFVYPVIAVGAFIFAFFAVTFNLFYLVFAALFIWGIARMKRLPIGYKKSHQLGLHLITFALLFDTLLFLALPSFHVPFLFTALMVLGAWFNLKDGGLPQTPSAPPPVIPAPH